MKRSQQIALAISVLTIAGLVAVAAPLIVSAASAIGESASAPATPSVAPVSAAAESPTPTPSQSDPLAGCEDPAEIVMGRMDAHVTGVVEDRGARPYAQGTVGFDMNGRITSYTVAAGDGFIMIGERLCIENAGSLDSFNHSRDIYPGQVLRLTQDPGVPNVPFFGPPDAPAGFQQIPYEQAIVVMRKAANAGDVSTMQQVWAKTLAPMFPLQADVDVISALVDAGDITMLRQMFA